MDLNTSAVRYNNNLICWRDISLKVTTHAWRHTLLFLCAGTMLLAAPIQAATVTFSESGISAKGVTVSFDALFDITGDTLTLTLTNRSPTASLNPDDTLSSFYFDIMNSSNVRPDLVYVSATGNVYSRPKNGSEGLVAAGVDLMAVNPGDDTWQFKTFDDTQSPFLGFGIGTAGNSNLKPNGFNGNIVGGVNYSIYKGMLTTNNLSDKYMVKESATFVFNGLAGYTVDDVTDVVFGLGTGPDSTLPGVPVPAAVWLFGSGLLGLVSIARHKKTA